MSRQKPTQSQMQVLQLLSAFEYLTTREIYDYLGAPATRRAVEQRLQLLKKRGFIAAHMLNPVQGAASERCWSLLRKGYQALGLNTEQEAGSGSSAKCVKRGATPREREVLQLLAEMKHLTTGQIHRHLYREKPKQHTWQLLGVLQELGYVRGRRMYPEMGAASEFYWTIRKAGAEAIGARYDRRYLRRPARRTIEHRGLLLEMSRQVHAAGWSLLTPKVGRQVADADSTPPLEYAKESQGRKESHDTPHRARLVEAVLHMEAVAIERLVEQGHPVSGLRDRIDRLRAGQVGAVVPRVVNDYVAYVPERPELTAVLIPHPSWVGRAFWVRKPGSRRRSAVLERPKARVERYARLARVLPMIAVFSTEEAAAQYAPLLYQAGFHWTTADRVGEVLIRLLCPPLKSGKGPEVENTPLHHSRLPEKSTIASIVTS